MTIKDDEMIDIETPTWTSEGRLIHKDGTIASVTHLDDTGRLVHRFAYELEPDRRHVGSDAFSERQ